MNRWVKRLLAIVAYTVMIGGPLLGVTMVVLATALHWPNAAVMAPVAVIYALIGLTMGGILRLLVSIDDRLEQAARLTSKPAGD